MTDDERYPSVPEEALAAGGWVERERSEETLFRLPTARVRGHTVVYEDPDLRAAVERAADGALDLPWRFCFVTRVSFVPPLVPAVGPATVFPSVLSEARSAFGDDLEARGFVDVERGRSQRMRTLDGKRAHPTKYEAEYPLPDGSLLPVTGWLAVWVRDGEFLLAGGAYPSRGVLDLPVDAGDVESDPNDYRDDLLDLIRAVT